MSAPYGAPPSSPGERWSVNYPAVIGVIFVFLVGVVVWVIVSGDGGDGPDGDALGGSPTAVSPPASTSAPPDTSPAPMPSTTAAAVTSVATSAASSVATSMPPPTAPVTAAPSAGPDAVPGDLGVPGRPMQQPGCDGAYITVLASAVGGQATSGGIANVLESYPGSNYLRTDQTCPSLTPDIDGEPIYVVYLGPFAFDSDACAARAEGPEGAYARILSDEVGPDHSVACA